MSKRQMVEDTVEGPSESMAKRSRVDISDLLGHAAEAGPYNNTVDASHRDGQNSGGNESATDNHTATNRGEAAKDGSGGLTISIDLPPATGHAMTQSTRPAVKFKKPPNAVYIALQRLENHREEESMQGDILGVFGDVERANQTVQREFLENYGEYSDCVHHPQYQLTSDRSRRSWGPAPEVLRRTWRAHMFI